MEPATRVRIEVHRIDGVSVTELFGTAGQPIRCQVSLTAEVHEKPSADGTWMEYEPTGFASVEVSAFGRVKPTGDVQGSTVFRQQCAAITNGCPGALVWEERDARYRPGDELSDYARRQLQLNGWRLDHGKWVCGLHGEPA